MTVLRKHDNPGVIPYLNSRGQISQPTSAGIEAGFTIVEMMVAVTIGLIILAGLSQIFATSRATYKVDEGLSRMQETGRFAYEFISKDVRMAGYSGCLNKSVTVTNNLDTPTDFMTDFGPGKHLTGHAYVGPGNAPSAWEPDLPAAYFVAGEVVENTDVLVIRRAAEAGVKIEDPMPDTSADLKISGNPTKLNQFDIVMIGDCESADIFQITGPASLDGSNDNNLNHNAGVGTPGNLVKPFSKAYKNNAEILKLVTSIYYIGRRGNVATNPPALFRKELAGTTGGGSIAVSQELLEGVERMNVMFGEDTDNNRVADQYKRANNVTNFANVLNARVGILVRTVATVESQPDPKTYDVAGVSYGPVNDKYRRQVYNSTISLRNP